MRTRLALAACGLLLSNWAAADCSFEHADSPYAEQNRIRDCLLEHARQPITDDVTVLGYTERRLYTWVPKIKIDRMRADPYFCDYELARQREFELRNLAPWWASADAAWYDRERSPTMAALTGLEDDAKKLSLLFVLPGLTGLPATPEQRRQRLENDVKELADQPPSALKSAAEGRLAGLNMPATGLRDSSIKSGRGVYFSPDPFRFFVAEENNELLVCDVPGGRSIVDLADDATADSLVASKIWSRASVDLPGAKLVPFFQNPRLFDAAARGVFIVRAPFPAPPSVSPGHRVYVDKCAIEYTACRPISVGEESLDCRDFARLAGLRKSRNGVLSVDDGRPVLGNSLLQAFGASADFTTKFPQRLQSCFGKNYGDAVDKLLRQAGRGALADKLR